MEYRAELSEHIERASLTIEFLSLYSSLQRDADSEITDHWLQEAGKIILAATRDEDEPSLRVKLLYLWTTMVIGRELPEGKVQSLSCILARLVDLEEETERTIPMLKDLSLGSGAIVEFLAVKLLFKTVDVIHHKLGAQDLCFWRFFPAEIWLCIFQFLDLRNLRCARLVSTTWCNLAGSFLRLRFPYHGCDQNVIQFLQLSPIRMPLEISSCWTSSELKEQLDANLDQLKQLKSISLRLAWGKCPSCNELPKIEKSLELTVFWRIWKFIDENKISLKSLNLAKHSQNIESIQFLHRLAEDFPTQQLSLEELTLTTIKDNGTMPENDDIAACYKLVQSCQGLKSLRIGITSLQFPSDITWKQLSYLQLRVRRISRQNLAEFGKFLRRHKNLKRLVLCFEGLQQEEVEEEADQEEADQEEADQKEADQFIKEIQATLQGIDLDVRIVNPWDLKWIE